MTKQQIELEYFEVKAKIKAELIIIKSHAEIIHNSKNKIDQLGKQIEQLQQQYLEFEAKNEK